MICLLLNKKEPNPQCWKKEQRHNQDRMNGKRKGMLSQEDKRLCKMYKGAKEEQGKRLVGGSKKARIKIRREKATVEQSY